jgi:hypothetical protein
LPSFAEGLDAVVIEQTIDKMSSKKYIHLLLRSLLKCIGISYIRSADNGKTWSDPILLKGDIFNPPILQLAINTEIQEAELYVLAYWLMMNLKNRFYGVIAIDLP